MFRRPCHVHHLYYYDSVMKYMNKCIMWCTDKSILLEKRGHIKAYLYVMAFKSENVCGVF